MSVRAAHGFAPRAGDLTPHGQSVPTGKYGRMFPVLAPLAADPQDLIALGALMVDSPATPSGDNPNVPSGYTYLGQFINHDVTFDPTSLQETRVDPVALTNYRTAALNLDALYGSGPLVDPQLYQREDPALFQIGLTSPLPPMGSPEIPVSLPFDLPRAPNGFALIGDPRNDENLIVAQLHLAFLRFHNAVVGAIRRQPELRPSPSHHDDFLDARALLLWHYQWIVLDDFLPAILDPEEYDLVRRRGSSLFNDPSSEPFVPVEFSAAAYRFGHAMIRSQYDLNRVFRSDGGIMAASLDLLFRFSGRSGNAAEAPIASNWIIDWRRFFPLDGTPRNHSRLIDPYLSAPLAKLPGMPDGVPSLAARDLIRAHSLGLPSAQAILRFLGMQALSPDEIARSGPDGQFAARAGLHKETPLWYYMLKESQLAGGRTLGKLGSRIVAEVFLGLLKRDASSFFVCDPEWKPTLPAQQAGHFTMADLLRLAGDLNPLG